MGFSATGCGVEHQEVIVHILVNLHDACLVCASVAVVGGREDGDHVLLVAPVEAVHHKLMGARN